MLFRSGTPLSVLHLGRRSGFFFAAKIGISANAEEINQHADHVPRNHRSRNNQHTVVDPEDLKSPYIAAILGFMPALDRRLSIASRSGKTAKVVPKPAIKPKISER